MQQSLAALCLFVFILVALSRSVFVQADCSWSVMKSMLRLDDFRNSEAQSTQQELQEIPEKMYLATPGSFNEIFTFVDHEYLTL